MQCVTDTTPVRIGDPTDKQKRQSSQFYRDKRASFGHDVGCFLNTDGKVTMEMRWTSLRFHRQGLGRDCGSKSSDLCLLSYSSMGMDKPLKFGIKTERRIGKDVSWLYMIQIDM